MTLEEMKSRKKELGLSNKEIAARSGVPLGTVQKLFGGVTQAPRMETIIALEKILRKTDEKPEVPKVQVKKQGEYTLEDYYALPDERRVELIDGVIYDMAAPSEEHQLLSGELGRQVPDRLSRHHGTDQRLDVAGDLFRRDQEAEILSDA